MVFSYMYCRFKHSSIDNSAAEVIEWGYDDFPAFGKPETPSLHQHLSRQPAPPSECMIEVQSYDWV